MQGSQVLEPDRAGVKSWLPLTKCVTPVRPLSASLSFVICKMELLILRGRTVEMRVSISTWLRAGTWEGGCHVGRRQR